MERSTTLWSQCMTGGIQWILDMDISKFFDTLESSHLRSFLQHRVRDGVITRLIGKWLNAGVLEQGVLHYPEAGTPQGGSISPLLSNVYLHYVLDQWFAQEVKPRLRGRAFMIRFADDAVMGFEFQEDAEKVFRVLPKRFGKYGLTIHPDKTRLVAFGRPRGTQGTEAGNLRLFRLYPLLGQVSSGEMDRQVQDSPAALEARTQTDRRVVSSQSAPTGCGATPGAVPENSRPLRLLRHHG